MSGRKLLLAILILLCGVMARALDYRAEPEKFYEQSIYTAEYGLSFYPSYPPALGQEITLRLRLFKPAQRVSLYSDREQEIPLTYRQGHWWGKYTIPADYQVGGHYFIVWIKYPQAPPDKPLYWLKRIVTRKKLPGASWSKSEVWYQAVKPPAMAAEAVPPPIPFDLTLPETTEVWPLETVPQEPLAAETTTAESRPLVIKGNQTITFKARTLEGSKEGYTAGASQTREETLRVSVAGRAADTDIEASLFRSTALGVTQVGAKEEEISILMRRGSTEAYLGDFTADFQETEFTRLEKVLSGARVKGDYGNWGFNALYSSPKGEDKFTRLYGDGTQGPYPLGFAPVVINSERVVVDGVAQKRGDDYTIDYLAGTVTFLKKVIDRKSILQINYAYRQTLYQHATYGLRTFVKPRPNLLLGAAYLEDSDSLAGAADISSPTGAAINPQRHFVVGVDSDYVSDNLAVDGELAYSFQNLNLLSAAASTEAGKAGKFNLNASLGPVGLLGHVKKVDAQFQAIGDPNPKQGVWEYGGSFSYRPNSWFGGLGNYEHQRYTQGGVVYQNLFKTTKVRLSLEQLPALEYHYAQSDESNDPVTGSLIRRVITRNAAETIYQTGFLSTSVKGTVEKWLQQSPTEEVTDYRKINFGLATVGLEKFTLASNVELENRTEPTGQQPARRTYNLNLSATPASQYFVSTNFNIVADSVLGQTEVVDLSYRAQPSDFFKTDGKYTITSQVDDFPATSEAVSKHAASFSFELRPLTSLRLRYLIKPTFTRIERTQTLSYNNGQTQSEINLTPAKYALLGWLNKTGQIFNIYDGDYPNYMLKNNTQDTLSNLYTLKVAPLEMMSVELNHLADNTRSATLVSTQEPYTYTQGRSRNINYDAIAKTSLSEKFSFDTRYTYQKNDQGSGEAFSNLANTKSHTASLQGNWNLSQTWTWSLSAAYTRTTDYLLAAVTYTYTPGFGFIYRLGDQLRVDFDYAYAQSFAGAETIKTTYNLKSKYALSDFVNVILSVAQEVSKAPDYRLTDVTGNIEINL